MRLPRARVVTADPPWPFKDSLPGVSRGAGKNYHLMHMQTLFDMKLPPIHDDALLFLWRVSSMQREALDLIDAWGFKLKTEVVWVKRTPAGKRWFGMGRTVRAEHETCLIAHRGKPTILSKSVRSTFEAPALAHSQKPDCFYGIVEQLSAGPYVELFARRPWPGWMQYGLELRGT